MTKQGENPECSVQDYHMEIQVEINGTITVVNIRRQNRIKKNRKRELHQKIPKIKGIYYIFTVCKLFIRFTF